MLAAETWFDEAAYREFALRAHEYLLYCVRDRRSLEASNLAAAMWFNCSVEITTSLGMPSADAERFCGNDDNLTELAIRVQSITGCDRAINSRWN
ncbi:hypothetical protein KR51_00034680 [Rubidibacter lacunae KORDI 51-2]|uniref:Uncharacterized protein n=1 Tax=Rubidibacter lacunae KORDI 51-2 TaxID=582515 RepID=U5DF00_9CHRO|nr:hypothetical protein [Rubidibacter lacunae]ERN40176.1 hypothetical protein KR51_00034680 [Rubidibacter lacunae KORDI 51-2]